jgi:hypothetical protein
VRALRKLFGFFVLVGVAFAGIVVFRRRFLTRAERVDLYYEDGTLVSLEQGSDGAGRLLSHAHDAVGATRSA